MKLEANLLLLVFVDSELEEFMEQQIGMFTLLSYCFVVIKVYYES